MLSSPLPLQGMLITLLIGSFFVTALGSADPWWRPKEWFVFLMGAIWLICRPLIRVPGVPPRATFFLIPFLTWTVIQTFLIHVLPILQAKGAYVSIPWVWLTLLHLILLWVWFLDICNIFTDKNFRPIWWASVAIGTVLSILMLLQVVGADPVVWLLQRRHGSITWLSSNHVIGLMGNPFQAGACLAVLIPIMAGLGLWVPLALAALALLATQSASAVLAGLIGVLVSLWLSGRRLVCGLVGGIALLRLVTLHGTDFFSLSGRFPIWIKSAELWREKFLLKGTGLGTYKLLGITAQVSNPGAPPNVVRWAHNEWLQVGMETGLIGLILLLTALISILILAYRRRVLRPEASGILAAGAILSVSSIPFHLAPTAVTLLLALAAVIVSLKEA